MNLKKPTGDKRVRGGKMTQQEFFAAIKEIEEAEKNPSVRNFISHQENIIEDLEKQIDSLKGQRFQLLSVLFLSIFANVVSICSLLMIIQR